jgi:hypothetical protein
MYIDKRQDSPKFVDYGIMGLKLHQENKKDLQRSLKEQQAVIENVEETMKRMQVPEALGHCEQPEPDILKIDSFFKAYKIKQFKKHTTSLKAFKSLRTMKSVSQCPKAVTKEPLVTRVNIYNYKNHFNFSTNYNDFMKHKANLLNTDYNVTFKKIYPNDSDDVVTLANLVKKLDIKNNIKTETVKLKSPRNADLKYTPLNTDYSSKTNYSRPVIYEDIDKESTRFNSYVKYKPKSNKNLDKVFKLNNLFESFCKVEKKAETLLTNLGSKLCKGDTFNYEEKLHGHKPFGKLNPIKVAKMNIKRLYHL